MSFDILVHAISIPSTSPALCRAIINFLRKEECINKLRDLNTNDIRNLLAERAILERRARNSYRHISH